MAVGDREFGELSTRVSTVEAEVKSLRDTRHEHSEKIQKALFGAEAIDRRMTEVEEMAAGTARVVAQSDIPHVIVQLREHSSQLSALSAARAEEKTDFRWVLRILTFVLVIVVNVTVAIAVFNINRTMAALSIQMHQAAPPPPPTPNR